PANTGHGLSGRSFASWSHPGCDCANDARGHLILQIENVFAPALEAVRPDMRSRRRIYKLTNYAHPVRSYAHTAFEHVAHPKLPTDLLHIHGTALVGEGRVTRDHEQATEPR